MPNNKLRSDLRIRFELLGFVWVAGESLTDNEDQWEDMLQADEKGDSCLIPKV
jgi:hypothetical protein